MNRFHLSNRNSFSRLVLSIVFLSILIPLVVSAGDLNAPAAPNDANSAMFSIEAIYQRLLNGTAGDKRGGTPGTFQEPAGAPGSTMHTLNEVMGVAPAKDTVDGASPDQVVTGRKFWGLKDGAGWGLLGGTMPMAAITADSTQVKGGYIATTTLTAIDADLVTGNIKAGTTIFGVSGKTEVVDTTGGDAVATDLRSGKIAYVDGAEVTGIVSAGAANTNGADGAKVVTIPAGIYAGTETTTAVDAALESGNIKAGATIFGVTGNSAVVNTSSGNAAAGDIMAGKQAWVNGVLVTGTRYAGVAIDDPNPANWSTNRRWHNNGDNTITDTTTGLIWDRFANEGVETYGLAREKLQQLNTFPNVTPWRFPTLAEFQSITTGIDPVVTGSTHFFIGVENNVYWTASGYEVFIVVYNPLAKTATTRLGITDLGVFWAVRNP